MLDTSEEIRANFHLTNHPTKNDQDMLDTSEEIRANSIPGALECVGNFLLVLLTIPL